MSRPEPLEEQILAAMALRLERGWSGLSPWYLPRFVGRTYKPLDAVNEFPGYLVLLASEESGTEPQTIDAPGATMVATLGVEVMAYGAGGDAEPTDRVLVRLLAQAEEALLQKDLLGPDSDAYVDMENTRRVLDHETEVGAPYRSLRSHLYRVRFLYTRGEP